MKGLQKNENMPKEKNRKGEKYEYRKPEKRAMYSLRWLKNYLKYTPCKLI